MLILAIENESIRRTRNLGAHVSGSLDNHRDMIVQGIPNGNAIKHDHVALHGFLGSQEINSAIAAILCPDVFLLLGGPRIMSEQITI